MCEECHRLLIKVVRLLLVLFYRNEYNFPLPIFEIMRTMKGLFLVILASFSHLMLNAQGHFQSISLQNSNIKLEKIISGFDVPWSMQSVGENQLLIAQRQGRLWLVDVITKHKHEVKGLPDISDIGQGGLLDVVLAPNQKKSEILTIYFTYSKADKNKPSYASTVLAKADIYLKTNQLKNVTEVLDTISSSSKGQHFGSRIAFDQSGYVYFTVGDRGNRDNGQNLSNHAASIIRLNLDGTTPKDNPFANQQPAQPEIYTYGHRNPQGIVYDSDRDILWSIEHGPRGGDEVNVIEAGSNYGWPLVSFGKEYWGPKSVGTTIALKGMTMPEKIYIPSIAPSSLMLYQGEEFPQWQGSLMAGALAQRHLNIIKLDESGNIVGEVRLLEALNERVRSLAYNLKGEIFIGVDSGDIYKLSREKPAVK